MSELSRRPEQSSSCEEAKLQTLDRTLTAVGLTIIIIVIMGILLVSWYLSWRRQKDYDNWKKSAGSLKRTRKDTDHFSVDQTPEEAKEAAKQVTVAVTAITTGRRPSEIMKIVNSSEQRQELAMTSKRRDPPASTPCILPTPTGPPPLAATATTAMNEPFPLVIDTRYPRMDANFDQKLHKKYSPNPLPPLDLDSQVHSQNSTGGMSPGLRAMHMNEVKKMSLDRARLKSFSNQSKMMQQQQQPGQDFYDSMSRVYSQQRPFYSAENTPLISSAAMRGTANADFNLDPYSIYVNTEDLRKNKSQTSLYPACGPIYSTVQAPASLTVASQHDQLLSELLQRSSDNKSFMNHHHHVNADLIKNYDLIYPPGVAAAPPQNVHPQLHQQHLLHHHQQQQQAAASMNYAEANGNKAASAYQLEMNKIIPLGEISLLPQQQIQPRAYTHQQILLRRAFPPAQPQNYPMPKSFKPYQVASAQAPSRYNHHHVNPSNMKPIATMLDATAISNNNRPFHMSDPSTAVPFRLTR